jgi:putative toxin-antitoxin system antitoxin component (TIGR02293 family)
VEDAAERRVTLGMRYLSAIRGVSEWRYVSVQRVLDEHKPLSTEESERVVRLARVFAEAKHVLGSEAKARLWLQKPNRTLRGETPLHLLDTDIGANAVFDELGPIEHGVFA